MVDKFELKFKEKFNTNLDCVAVGSGTDALHLAYILSGIKKNDEVICPNLDSIQDKYLTIPLHSKISIKDANFISDRIIEILN